MKYAPRSPPMDLKTLQAWLSDELRRVSNAIGSGESLQLMPIDNEPERPSKGMLVWAVGVNWNPGAGEGLYVYDQTNSWVKVN